MTEAPPVQTPATTAGGNASLHPTFPGVLRGIWLFTWRSRLTWRRLPGALLILLILPALIYLTVRLPESWARHHSLLGSSVVPVKQFSRRLRVVEELLNVQQNR